MPIFDYHCKKCDNLFERIVSFSDADEPQTCPECESKDTEKKMTNSVGLHFKGDWFVNNNRY